MKTPRLLSISKMKCMPRRENFYKQTKNNWLVNVDKMLLPGQEIHWGLWLWLWQALGSFSFFFFATFIPEHQVAHKMEREEGQYALETAQTHTKCSESLELSQYLSSFIRTGYWWVFGANNWLSLLGSALTGALTYISKPKSNICSMKLYSGAVRSFRRKQKRVSFTLYCVIQYSVLIFVSFRIRNIWPVNIVFKCPFLFFVC